MYKQKPYFIVFEGVEGCGKTYQSKKLYNKLKYKKIKSILTREPGGTPSAELIRNLILKDYFNKFQKQKLMSQQKQLIKVKVNQYRKFKIKFTKLQNLLYLKLLHLMYPMMKLKKLSQTQKGQLINVF